MDPFHPVSFIVELRKGISMARSSFFHVFLPFLGCVSGGFCLILVFIGWDGRSLRICFWGCGFWVVFPFFFLWVLWLWLFVVKFSLILFDFVGYWLCIVRAWFHLFFSFYIRVFFSCVILLLEIHGNMGLVNSRVLSILVLNLVLWLFPQLFVWAFIWVLYVM